MVFIEVEDSDDSWSITSHIVGLRKGEAMRFMYSCYGEPYRMPALCGALPPEPAPDIVAAWEATGINIRTWPNAGVMTQLHIENWGVDTPGACFACSCRMKRIVEGTLDGVLHG